MEFGFRLRPYACLVALGFLFLGACQKKDEIPPDAQIQTPFQGAIYNVFDTVSTTFEFSDNEQVVSATVELINSNFVPVTPKMDVLGRTSAELIIDDKLLETGDYYVRLTVKDEQNTNSEFRRIKIVALPKERRAVFAAINTSVSSSEIWRVDSLLQEATLWSPLQQDVSEICVNSMFEQVSVAGKMSAELKSFNANSGTLLWEDAVFNVPQTRRYEDLLWFENSLYATIYDREVRSYDLSGSLTTNFATQEFRPETVFANNRFLLVEMDLVGDDNHFLNVYNSSTRALLWQTNFQFDITSICPLEEDVVLIFGNENGQAKMVEYNMVENTFWEPRTFPSGEVVNVVATESNRFAVAHASGLYMYTYSPNFLDQISAQVPTDMKYDTDNGTLLITEGNTLSELTVTGAQLNSFTFPADVVSFDVYYTR